MQVVVDGRRQPIEGRLVAIAPRDEQLRDVGPGRHPARWPRTHYQIRRSYSPLALWPAIDAFLDGHTFWWRPRAFLASGALKRRQENDHEWNTTDGNNTTTQRTASGRVEHGRTALRPDQPRHRRRARALRASAEPAAWRTHPRSLDRYGLDVAAGGAPRRHGDRRRHRG